jgi:WS/DGAT/MGAT family acyltransferase
MSRPASEPLLDWGRAPALDAFETLMWRMDRYPNLRSAVVGMVVLDKATDPDRVRAAHEWGTRAVPRLRERLAEVPFGRPEWVADADFALDEHLQFVDLPSPGSDRQLLDLAAAFAMEPFDRARPPWAARMINGLSGGRSAYVLKLHHAMSDGIGIVQLLSFMFSRQRAPLIERRNQPLPEPPAAVRTDTASILQRQARRELRKLPSRLRSGFDAARRFLSAGEGRRSRVSELASYAGSLRRALAPDMATPSPLLAERNNQWRFEVLDFPLAPFKAASKACGATLNDAFVAGLLGGFARYHRELGVDVDEMPIGMPINIRKADAAGGGNHFAPGQLVGPLGDLSPRERMSRIGEQVARQRNEPALAAPLALMPLLASMPADAVSKLMGPKMAMNDLQCSNVPGIRDDVFIAGAQATHVYPFAPAPGVPAMITLVTHGATCCIGMNLDSGAITEPERFVRCMRESFEEIISLKAA